METTPTVFLVDDDVAVRESLAFRFHLAGLEVKAYASPSEVIADVGADAAGCFVLDLSLPEMNGLELHRMLVAKGCSQPCVMISGHGTIRSAVDAMQQGVVDFLEKPFAPSRLLTAVFESLQRDAEIRRQCAEQKRVAGLMARLTNREREVLEHVVDGSLTVRIARQLGISPKTVEVHRSRILAKLEVDSVPQLILLCLQNGFGTGDATLESHHDERQRPAAIDA